MSKIMICGITHSSEVSALNRLTPDYVGFVLGSDETSPRRISHSKAEDLKQKLKSSVQAVGIFENESIDFIESYCDNDIIDLVQLDGDEDDRYILELSRRVPVPIIKTVKAKSPQDIIDAEKLHCQYLRLGSFDKAFNLDIIPNTVTKPFFLAGKLSAENIRDIIGKVRPYCVDVCAAVETDGLKDAEKMKVVIEKAHRHDDK